MNTRIVSAFNGINRSSISKKNRKLIAEFIDKAMLYPRPKRIGIKRAVKYIYALGKIAEFLKKDFDKVERKDVEEFVKYIEATDYSDWTKKDYKQTIKKYYRVMEWNEDDPLYYPKMVRWVSTSCNSKLTPPTKLVNEKDVELIISKCMSIRDKAMLRFLFCEGVRVQELLNIRCGDLDFDRNEVFIRGTKTPHSERIIPLLEKKPVPLLLQWLSVHPDKNNIDAPLWASRTIKNKSIVYNTLIKMLEDVYRRAGITDKLMNPHSWRKASATSNCHLFDSYAGYCKFFGWKIGSDTANIYYRPRTSGENGSHIKNRSCISCGSANDSSDKLCIKCGFTLDDKTRILTEIKKEVSKQAMDYLFNTVPEVKQALEKAKAEILKKIDIENIKKRLGGE